jgi:hypothetical protein
MRIAALLLSLLLAAPAWAAGADAPVSAPVQAPKSHPATVPVAPAAGPESPDARFDKTGDGLVDAADWARMTEAERRAYARASLQALGEDPDAPVGNGKQTRLDLYLDGLRAVYR